MSTCAICLDALKSPVALPCGHVYCHGCISETIKATTSTSLHAACCPTCREPVSTVTPNPLFIPSHLRPYVLPPFRRIYLNSPAPDPAPVDDDDYDHKVSGSSADDVDKRTARLHVENAVLRQSCHAWRARANAHVAAHVGLSALLRLAREQARILKVERDELAKKCDALKRKFSDVDDRVAEPEPETDEGESIFIWAAESVASQAQEEEGSRIPQAVLDSEDSVPYDVPLVCPPADVPSVSTRERQVNSKRRRISPPTVWVPAKSARSMPAMVIPHLVSHRSHVSQDP